MIKRLEPFLVKHKSEILQLTGINQENSIGFLNEKGEIALLQFDEDMNPTEKVIEPGFPGYSEGDLELSSDPEYSFIWLRRGKGVYFADAATKKTGHTISMRPGSKIFQVFLANPDEKKWWIIYGVSQYAIDEYDLDKDKKTTFDFTLQGEIWPFGKKEFLIFSTNFSKNKKWEIINENFSQLTQTTNNNLVKKLNSIPGLRISYKRKVYNLNSKIMIGYILSPPLYYSIQWNTHEDDEKDDTIVTPFTSIQQPSDIEGLGGVMQFSSDGKWCDISASHKFNGITNPEERFVYHVNRSFPAGVSPPIRLGLAYQNIDATFMNHSNWGPCYVMQDSNDLRSLKIFKLHDGLKLFSTLL